MTGHVTTQTAPTQTVPAVTSPDGFHTRTLLDMTTAVLWPLMLAATLLMVVAGFSAAPIGPGVPVVVAVALTAFARSRRAERAQSRAALAQLRGGLAQLGDPVKEAEKLRKDRDRFEAAERERSSAYPRAQDKLTAQYHAELRDAEKRKVRKQRDIDKKINGLSEELRKALAKALTDKQSAYVRDQLGRRLIAQSPPHGIGRTLAARLAAAGIRTAADFKGYRSVQNTHYNSTGAVLVLSSGRVVDVQGIGEAKAIALDVWRRDLVASAEARQPTDLSASERQSIEQGVARRRDQLIAGRVAVESEIDALRVKALRQMEDGQQRLTRENTLAGDRSRQQRQEFSRRTVALQQDGALHGTLSDSIDAAKLRQRGLSYTSYVRFLYTGR
jgi:hypothetical protein